MFYWLLKFVFLGPIVNTLLRPQIEGVENIPETGGALLASNHLSYMDWIVLPLKSRRRITFLAKADYFTGRGIKGRLTAGFFRGAGQVPIDRTGGRASEAAIDKALEILAEGQLLGIYPEGTRSPDGRLYRGKTGIARMALDAKVPVIPVAMIGLFEVAPPGRRVPRVRRVKVRIGRPLDFSRYEGMSGDRFVLRSITDEIMYEMMSLSGQEYVDTYASRAKADSTDRPDRGPGSGPDSGGTGGRVALGSGVSLDGTAVSLDRNVAVDGTVVNLGVFDADRQAS